MAPVAATTDPTDRSIWPAMMMTTMPIARMRMYEFCTTMLLMFCGTNS